MLLCLLSAKRQGSSPRQEMQCAESFAVSEIFLGEWISEDLYVVLYLYGTENMEPVNIHGQNFVVYAVDNMSLLQVPECCIEFTIYRLNIMDEESSAISSTPNPTHHKISACFPLNFTCLANWKRISEVMITIWRHSHSRSPDGTLRAGRLVLPPGLGKAHRKQWQGPEKLLWLC